MFEFAKFPREKVTLLPFQNDRFVVFFFFGIFAKKSKCCSVVNVVESF